MIIGIDIGTSYSSVAYLKDGKPEKIKPGTENDYSIPSAAYMKDDGSLLIGRAAIATRMKDPSRFKSNFKRDFGTVEPYLLGGQEVTTQEIYTEYFRYFKQSAERITGQEVSKAYITHPVNYSDEKKLQLEQAANYAGLLDVVLIDEPTAAALSFFVDNKPQNGEKLLIFDLGGGTLDLTLAEIADGGLRLLAESVGDANIGGADFDRLLYTEIVDSISKENDLSEALSSMRFSIELIGKCVEAKHNLSRDDSSLISIPFGFGEYIEHVITRERFNELISAKLDDACALIENIAKNAGLTPAQIDRVLCVGGSTRIPFVAKRVGEKVGKTVLATADPELAVCMGAILREVADVAPPKTDDDISDINTLRYKAEQGDIESMYALGCKYRNDAVALKWYAAAAAQGHKKAKETLDILSGNERNSQLSEIEKKTEPQVQKKYYIHEGSLYQSDLDNSNQELLFEKRSSYLSSSNSKVANVCVYKNYVYFILNVYTDEGSYGTESCEICIMDLDTRDKKRVKFEHDYIISFSTSGKKNIFSSTIVTRKYRLSLLNNQVVEIG